MQDLTILNTEVGQGGHGEVRVAKWGDNDVAIKRVLSGSDQTQNTLYVSLMNEMKVLSKLKHPNIVQMFGFCEDETVKERSVCIVMKYYPKGSLDKYLYNADLHLDTRVIIQMMLSIASGMSYLHSMNIRHQDLKPDNILVKNFNPKENICDVVLCDFGLSMLSDVQNSETIQGTVTYAAPEIKTGDYMVDAYSFAIILWEACTREKAWSKCKFNAEIEEQVKNGARPDVSGIHVEKKGLVKIIEKCWSQDPKDRFTFEQIFEELKKCEKGLPLNSPVSGLPLNSPSSARRPEMVIEEKIEGRMDDSTDWEAFENILMDFGCEKPEKFKILCEGNKVSKEKWTKYINYFQPLITSRTKHSAQIGFTLGQVADVISLPFFHGDLSASEAIDVLETHGTSGSYLLRFSSSKGNLTLTVREPTDYANLRISYDLQDGQIVFCGGEFKSVSIRELMDEYERKSPEIDGKSFEFKQACNRIVKR